MKYIYAIYASVLFVVIFLLLFPIFLILGTFNCRKAIWFVIRIWSIIWFFLLGMYIQRIFLQKPNTHKRYIVIANHYSYLDTALIFRTFPIIVKPLAMQALAKVPLFGYLYSKMAILVDRKNTKSKINSLKKIKEALTNGDNILIFPEGSFNQTDKPIKHFYDGAFKLALETQTDILPVLFPDTNNRWNNKSFWNWSPGKNRVVFLPEISIANYTVEEADKLKSDVHTLMTQTLSRYL